MDEKRPQPKCVVVFNPEYQDRDRPEAVFAGEGAKERAIAWVVAALNEPWRKQEPPVTAADWDKHEFRLVEADFEPGPQFFLLENDGHNTPLLWKFRDQLQAEQFLAKRFNSEEGMDGEKICPGYFDADNGWTDPNGTIWEASSGELSFIDKTKEP